MAEIKVGDRVVQLVNQFTAEQIEELQEQVQRTKFTAEKADAKQHAKPRGKRQHPAWLKTEPDRGVVKGVINDGENTYYFVETDLPGRSKPVLRRVIDRKVMLESEYDPEKHSVEVPYYSS